MLEVICTIFFILVVIGLWIILYDTHHFVVRRYRFSSEKIKKPIRMVKLSDLHNYQYGRENSELLAAIDKAAPDMIVIAGDMITAAKKEKFDKTLTFLKALRDKYPVYYAYGNHEQKIELYKGTYGDMGERFAKGLREAGIEPLHNGHVMLPDRGIAIYGLELERAYFQRFTKKNMPDTYLAELLGKKDEGCYTVLLAHNPDYFPEYAKWGADLVLAGHVHGGIVRVPFLGGLISPSLRLFPKYDGGLYTEGHSHMALGRGIGTHSPKVRVLNPAELLVIEVDRTGG
ncbi:MAG: metallophosphoesterase [Lachnospiraceae bacterium]|nr:metallophosphoesterase [Lachnospiraceae bacterium]